MIPTEETKCQLRGGKHYILQLATRWGPELRLWVVWGRLCVMCHHSADDPEHDTNCKNHTRDVTCENQNFIGQVHGQPKEQQRETQDYQASPYRTDPH